MIRRTFRVLTGVGPRTEQRIRRGGVADWDDFLTRGGVSFASPFRNRMWCDELARWREALARQDERFFHGGLPPSDHWRLFEVFGADVAFLDIETTGMAPPDDEPTLVGIYRPGVGLAQFVAGEGLSGDALDAALEGVKLLITFYGVAFDVPFLKRTFSWVRFEMPHFDLCFAAKSLGVGGGLKKVEKQFGIGRAGDVDGLNGYDAVKLWQAHLNGRPGALDLLMRYNAADTMNLVPLAEMVYRRLLTRELALVEQTP